VRSLEKEAYESYNMSQDGLYRIVESFYSETEKRLAPDAYETLKELRKTVKDQLKINARKAVADQVLEKAAYIPGVEMSRNVYSSAIKHVCRMTGISETTVRGYIKEFYPNVIPSRSEYSDEYCLEFANRILNNNILQGDAKNNPGFYATMEYIEKNEPELYAEIKKMWNENRYNRIVFSEKSSKINYLKDPNLLVKILLEFRISPTDACTFVNRFRNIFLNSSVEVLTTEELMSDLQAIKDSTRDAVKWYLFESVSPDQYSEYRLQKFNNFASQLETLINDEKRLKEFVNYVCYDHLEKLSGRTPQHFVGNHRNYTLEEAYILGKYAYKMGLSESMRGNIVYAQTVRNDMLVPKLKQSPNIEEQMIADGLKKLGEYNLAIVDADHNDRRKQGKY